MHLWQQRVVVLFVGLLGLGVSACGGEGASAATSAPSTEIIPSPTLFQVVQQPTLAPTPNPTTPGPTTIVIWWPDTLAPVDNARAADLLSAQFSGFEAANDNTRVEFRLKKLSDAGGILSTLRNASAIAPGALPDLTLVRYEDLPALVQAGLVQPMEGKVSSGTVGDLTNLSRTVLLLGQVNNQLYGVPYMLDVLLVAYRPADDSGFESWRFEDVLTRQIPLVFSAAQANPINATFWIQYLSAGGSLPQGGVLTLNPDALRIVLSFYEQARAAQLISPASLEYTTSSASQNALLNRTVDMAIINSTLYLQMVANDSSFKAAPVPTFDGTSRTTLNGWLWVLTTSNADRQEAALSLLNWLMVADRQGQYAEVIRMLPSQRTAFASWQAADEPLLTALLDNAVLPLTTSEGGALARAMQAALIAVISGERTAAAAADSVIEQVGG